jgi:hypothetical protein
MHVAWKAAASCVRALRDGCHLHHISVSPHVEGRESTQPQSRAPHRKRNADRVSSDEKLRYTDCLRPCAARPMSRARRSRCVLAHARPRWQPPPCGPAASWRCIRRARVALQATPQPAAPPTRAIAPPLTPCEAENTPHASEGARNAAGGQKRVQTIHPHNMRSLWYKGGRGSACQWPKTLHAGVRAPKCAEKRAACALRVPGKGWREPLYMGSSWEGAV